MELTDYQKDALTELINIAFARTAASLSDLTGNRDFSSERDPLRKEAGPASFDHSTYLLRSVFRATSASCVST